ncbi:Imm50 family immunity protein [Streptomyces sp. CNS654]|uniref:Imm50 family immunity protein n=1 Tax=Streptomyces sp. CNS654 TaxID=1506995 RepID=UPI00067DAEA4|nr:Imm50 family immunity protein [Streptomyces sp. CNS654]
MTPHWIDLTRNSDVLGTLYVDVPPLDSVRLRSFHLDWRGPALTLRVDLPAYPDPDRVPPEWSELGHDTLQLHVQFTAVEDLTMHGWIPTAHVDVSIVALAGRRTLVRIAESGFDFSFTASDSLTVGHISSYRQTETGSGEVPHSFVSRLDARLFTSLPGTHESAFYQ